jgi:hypothetical protein
MDLDAADMLVLNLWELVVTTVENRRMPVEEAKENNQNGLMVKGPSNYSCCSHPPSIGDDVAA